MTIGYKVVRFEKNILTSYNYDYDPNNQFTIKYEVNKIIKAPGNTRLFVYNNYLEAFASKDFHHQIYKCEYVGGIEYNGVVDGEQANDFWIWFNEVQSKKKGFKNVHCPFTLWNWNGVVLVKQLRLIERVE